MKIAIIGAGNMGSAIAKGIYLNNKKKHTIAVSNPSSGKLQVLSQQCPRILTTTCNAEAIINADIMIIAVKPGKIKLIADELSDAALPPVIVSVAAGISTLDLQKMFGSRHAYIAAMPNTAIAVGQSMTFLAHRDTSIQQLSVVKDLFESMGQVAIIDEALMMPATAISGCAIAYIYKYIQASIQAAVQLGFTPHDAQKYTIQTIKGAIQTLGEFCSTPSEEIDKVTSPGGMTIRGINRLEEEGFTAAIIKAIIQPLKSNEL